MNVSCGTKILHRYFKKNPWQILKEEVQEKDRHFVVMIEPHEGDKRYVRRDGNGRFSESDDQSRSLSTDRKRKANTKAKPGQGDRGDR